MTQPAPDHPRPRPVRRRHPPEADGAFAPAPRPAPLPTSFTAAELMGMVFPEPRWAVPGILAEGVSLLAGPPKVGKSWMAYGLAIVVAAGGKAFGVIDTAPGPVLYLALEDTPRRLQARMRILLAGDTRPARAHPRHDLPDPARPAAPSGSRPG